MNCVPISQVSKALLDTVEHTDVAITKHQKVVAVLIDARKYFDKRIEIALSPAYRQLLEALQVASLWIDERDERGQQDAALVRQAMGRQEK